MKYQEIKEQKQNDYNKLFDTCQVFWAFSNEQFIEGAKKNPKHDDEKYVSIGAGGYLPKHNVEALQAGTKAIDATFKAQITEFKMREKHILYELNNHECFYTGDIIPAVDALGEGYTIKEVETVQSKYKAKKYQRPTLASDYIIQDESGTIHKITEEQAETIKNNMESQHE